MPGSAAGHFFWSYFNSIGPAVFEQLDKLSGQREVSKATDYRSLIGGVIRKKVSDEHQRNLAASTISGKLKTPERKITFPAVWQNNRIRKWKI